VSEDRWPLILEHCSFQWMKSNEDKFEGKLEVSKFSEIKLVKSGGMLRKGEIGDYVNFFTPELLVRWTERTSKEFPTKEQQDWCENGGVLP